MICQATRIAIALLAVWLAAPGSVAAQEIKLKLSHFLPAAHNHHVNVIMPWVEEVKKRTNGRVEITVFPTASLCKPPQQYDCAKSGIADLAWGVTGWTPGRFPMSSVIELPYMHRSAAVGSQMLADLWPKYLSKEYDDVYVLYMNVHPAGHIHTHSKLVRTLDDFKGMKIRTPTAVVGDILDTLGATKVGMPAPHIYEAMSNKVVDGFGMPFEALPSFRLIEVSKYHTEVGKYTTAFAMFMNKARFDSLPPDVRRVLIETTSAQSGYWRRVGESSDMAEIVGRFPVVMQLGFDPIWFGVIIVVTVQIGLVSPPVGLNVFVIAGMARDVPMPRIFRGIMPFLAAMVVLLVLLTVWPDLALILPRTMK